MANPTQRIVIVGGGTAGWLTAGLLAAEHQADSNNARQISVTLLESPDVKTIGVGEGTWPSMRNTLARIGISESEFMRKCDASFKQASKFMRWRNDSDDDFYYHPFMVPEGYTRVNLHQHWKTQHAERAFADSVNMQSVICEQGLAPKQTGTPEYAGVMNYGYHLDAGKFTDLLTQHCTQNLNVQHIRDHMTEVVSSDCGDIAGVQTKQHGIIEGDLFVDCTGLRALLLGEHFGVKFQSQKHILFNDSALAIQVPHPTENADIASATLSTAQDCGWIWDIALPTRRGVGYTYSSAHCDDDNAMRTLKQYLSQIVGEQQAAALQPRKISFNPGYREKFWHRNCVAVGMSAGFLEPLEASALAMIELSITMISEELPKNRRHMDLIAARYNDRFEYRWQRVIEFLKLHYVLSQRDDSAYWRDNKEPDNIPERLAELIELWRHQPPSRYDFIQNEEIFASASYQYVLYGMGFDTTANQDDKRMDNPHLATQLFQHNNDKIRQFSAGLPTNGALLQHLQHTDFPTK